MTKLLHVDDDEDIREITKMALEIFGEFEVKQCASGEEALRAVGKFIPDVLLLDVMMPGLTGPQTLEKIRMVPGLADVPVIFLTARAISNDNKELWDLGALEVINKPFDPMLLSQQIKTALNRVS